MCVAHSAKVPLDVGRIIKMLNLVRRTPDDSTTIIIPEAGKVGEMFFFGVDVLRRMLKQPEMNRLVIALGIDLDHLHTFLSDDDFLNTFGISRIEFDGLDDSEQKKRMAVVGLCANDAVEKGLGD